MFIIQYKIIAWIQLSSFNKKKKKIKKPEDLYEAPIPTDSIPTAVNSGLSPHHP